MRGAIRAGRLGEAAYFAPPLPQDDGAVARQVNHGGRLYPAGPAVDNQLHPARQRRPDVVGIGQRHGITGQQQGGTHQRLLQSRQQSLWHRMVRNPDADRLAPGVLQPARHLPRCLQYECIGPWRVGTQQAVCPVVDPGVTGDLGQIAAYQREVMVLARVTNPLEAIGRIPRAELPAERIGGIRRVDHQASATNDFDRLPDQAGLGIYGMNVKALRHARILPIKRGLSRDIGICHMQAFLDFLPVIAFFAAYWLADMKTAILVIMVVISVQVLITWVVKRTVPRMLLTSALLVVVMGGGSLLLNNELIFKWKPTVLNWLFAGVFLGSRYIGDKPVVQRLLTAVAKDEFSLSSADWQRLNLMWVAFFVVSGAANILVAYRFSEGVWVNFKLFGLLGMTLVFVLLQAVWIGRRVPDAEKPVEDN